MWGPAWVEWRYDDDYIGWAPLTLSASFSMGLGVTYTHGWVAPIHYWNFVPCRNFTTTRVVDYVQPIERTRRFFGNTRGADNIRSVDRRIVNRGVDLSLIERKSGTSIKRVDVVASPRGGGERILRNAGRDKSDIRGLELGRLQQNDNRRPNRDVEIQRDRRDDLRAPVQNDDKLRRWNDQQPVRVPREEGRQSVPPGVRQNRESEQRFEIPRNGNNDRSGGGAIQERQQKMNTQEKI